MSVPAVPHVKMLAPYRDRACAGLAGKILELGFGSGTNIGHYPAAVTGVVAIEPSDTAWRLSAPARKSSATSIERGSIDGQILAEADGSFDAALSTFTLCTVENPAAALAGGCHLTRSVEGMLRDAGFSITALDSFYAPGAPRFESALSLGTATGS